MTRREGGKQIKRKRSKKRAKDRSKRRKEWKMMKLEKEERM